ncbi:MAG: TIGR00269 family protein [Thermoplasmata archaeon]
MDEILTPKCSLCGKPSIIYINYSGNNLCKMHFIEFVKDRVIKNIKEQIELKPNIKIAIAVSGGKDSMGMLKLMSDVLPPIPGLKLVAVTVDEGIEGYRNLSIPKVKKLADSLGIEHMVISFREMGLPTMDEVSKKDIEQTPCAFCGVWRRKGMNLLSKKVDADYIAVGMNLDDIAQSILMNYTKGDIGRMARLGPHNRKQKGLVPRVLPIVNIPEKEMYIYSLITGIDFYRSSCPYSNRAMRNIYRDIVNMLEDKMPGTRHAILNTHKQLLPLIQAEYPLESLNKCIYCGEPSTKTICKSCELELKLKTIK